MTIKVREGNQTDLPFILEGLADIQSNERDSETDLELSESFLDELKTWVINLFDTPSSLIIVMENQQLPIGFVIGMVEPQHNPFSNYNYHGIIQAIYVCEQYRLKGFATQLVNEIMDSFQEHLIPYVEISYHPINKRAQKFWKKMGFANAQVIARKFLSTKNKNQ